MELAVFPICAMTAGMTTLWISEIDKWANEVTIVHFGANTIDERG